MPRSTFCAITYNIEYLLISFLLDLQAAYLVSSTVEGSQTSVRAEGPGATQARFSTYRSANSFVDSFGDDKQVFMIDDDDDESIVGYIDEETQSIYSKAYS